MKYNCCQVSVSVFSKLNCLFGFASRSVAKAKVKVKLKQPYFTSITGDSNSTNKGPSATTTTTMAVKTSLNKMNLRPFKLYHVH